MIDAFDMFSAAFKVCLPDVVAQVSQVCLGACRRWGVVVRKGGSCAHHAPPRIRLLVHQSIINKSAGRNSTSAVAWRERLQSRDAPHPTQSVSLPCLGAPYNFAGDVTQLSLSFFFNHDYRAT